MAKLNDELAALTSMSPRELRHTWRRVHKSEPPDSGPSFLALGIAHRLQARYQRDLEPAIAREIAQLGAVLERNGTLSSDPAATIKPGTRLVREWHGTTHQVMIMDGDYLYRDQRYQSLSRIAREITGVTWSGPRFFGLRKRGPERRKERSNHGQA